MRLTSLDLICYGAFAGRSLALRPDAKLHVVYGANEAGKSSTLAAVRDLLFGFPARTMQDFRFKQTDLRLGGEVLARDGARLAFVRRKGNKNTLLAPDGAPLADDALAPFLGQMTREIFGNAFGLDAVSLRQGAEELLQARGEVGSSLMAAASGLRGLSNLRKRLDEEADAIFTPNKSQSRRFYQARDRYELAKKTVGELELRAGAWKKLNEGMAQSAARLEELKQARYGLASERARMARLKRLAPLLRRIDAQDAAIASEAGLPDVPPGFVAELGAALGRAGEAARAQAKAQGELDEIARALQAISVDGALIERAGEIEALVQRVGKHQKDNVDLPRVAADHDGAQAELDRLARMLGLADARALVAAQPTQSALALVRDLAQQGQVLAQKKAGFELSLHEESGGLEALDASCARQAHVADPAPLQEKLRALGAIEALVAARDQKAQTLRREEEALRLEAARLAPAVADLCALAAAALPSAEVIAGFARRFEEAAGRERDAAHAWREATQDVEAARARLDALAAGADVPTPDRIAAARLVRDGEWSLLRASLFGEGGALQGAALAASVTRFELAGVQADALADAAARDATRVADYAAQSASLERLTQKLAGIERMQAESAAQREALTAQWQALWSPLAIAPLAPADMNAWRSALRTLLDRHTRLGEMRADWDSACADLAALEAPLAAIAGEAGLPPMQIDVARQHARIGARLRELAGVWDEARANLRRREDIVLRIAKLRRDLDDQSGKLEIWERRWRAALPAIGLAPEAGIAEALAAHDEWKLAPSSIEKRDDLARRVSGLRRDIAIFESDVDALVGTLAPDLRAQPPGLGVGQLNKRLELARTASARRDQIAKQKTACEQTLHAAERSAVEARTALATLAMRLPEGVDLEDVHARLARREEIASIAADLRRQLADQGEGHDEAQIRVDLAGFDADRAEADLAALAQEDDRLAQESHEVFAALSDARRQIGELQAGVGSETAWQQRVNAEAEMQDAARDWVVLRLASTMLEDALDRHRAERQDPLMQRASAIFSVLTGGAFSGIGQAFDANDVAALTAIRAGGEVLQVAIDDRTSALSEGTRDQLYLALRLAYVEDYAARAEPAPFIADDLFTSFDDARTLNGLRALAHTGERAQCILFTHHRHVADLARSEIGAAADIVDL